MKNRGKTREKCWYCGEKPRVSKKELFCKECKELEKKDKQSGTYIIYDKV